MLSTDRNKRILLYLLRLFKIDGNGGTSVSMLTVGIPWMGRRSHPSYGVRMCAQPERFEGRGEIETHY